MTVRKKNICVSAVVFQILYHLQPAIKFNVRCAYLFVLVVMLFITPGYSYLMSTESPADGSSLTAESSSPSLLSGVASQLAAISSVTVPLRISGVAARNCKQQQTQIVYMMFPKFVDKLQKFTKSKVKESSSNCAIKQFSMYIPTTF